MITIEGLNEANSKIKGVDLKGKKYALVAERVQIFRQLCPDGLITTEILFMEAGAVTMKASIYDETGKLLVTGLAQEKEGGSFINKTSYIENCETSAVGRALAMLGIGSECSMASAEEVVNAQMQQKEADKKQKQEIEQFAKLRTAVMRHINENKPPEKIRELAERAGGNLANMTQWACESYMESNGLIWDGKELKSGNQGQNSQHTADIPTAENAGNY